MKRMVLGLLLVVPLGCNKAGDGKAPSAKTDPGFDKQWSDLEHGGEVRRAVDPIANGHSPLAKEPLPGALPDLEVVKVIRANLSAVKGCYQIEERAGTVSSGKAIVTLQIDPAGSVSDVKVDAPAFAASKLPQCVGGRAKGWTFPKFTQGPKRFSYPFVFVGG
jgi:hypothetical protein